MKRTGPTNPVLKNTILELEVASRKNNAPIWKYVAELLSKPTRKRVEVNVGKLDRFYEDGKIILVPGVLLGSGRVEKPLVVSAWKVTYTAKKKIEQAGGKIITFKDLVKEDPKGSRVVIVV